MNRGIVASSERGAGSWVALTSGALACALSLALALFAAQPASAVELGHVYDFEFGSPGTGAGQFTSNQGFDVAVDQSNGDLYVTDGDNFRVQKFDVSGNFIMAWGYGVEDGSNEFQICPAPGPCQAGLMGRGPGQFEGPGSIAVDNSDGPNQGRVYVADSRQEILKFSPTGTYLGSIDGASSPGGRFVDVGTLYGHGRGELIDVDGQGFLWVLDAGRVMRFSNQPGNAYIGGSQWAVGGSGINAEPSGEAVYVNTGELRRYAPNGAGYRRLLDTGEIAIDPATNHYYAIDIYGENIQEYDGDPLEPKPIGPPFGNEAVGKTGMAVYSATGSVYVAARNYLKILVFKPRRVPHTVTEPATEVLHTTATLNGHTAPDPDEGGDVGACYFEWGLTTDYEHQIPCQPSAPLSTPSTVSAELSGLTMDSVYHYRLASANAIGTTYGEDQTFIPRAVLGTATGGATDLTASTATLHGSFDPNGEPTEYFFEWGKTKEKLDHSTPIEDAGSAAGLRSVSVSLEKLEDYTTYYYRMVAVNALGTSPGQELSFLTTAPQPPSVMGSASANVTDTSAQLSTVITPNFGEVIYGFEYGASPAYGGQVFGGGTLEADGLAHAVTVNLTGLISGEAYHFRPFAINFGGITYGPDSTLRTLNVPQVLTTTVSSITPSSVRLESLIHPSLSFTSVRFEYGRTAEYGSSTPTASVGAGSTAVPASADLGGLEPDTTYHFRAVASNAIGVITGPDQSFTTGGGSVTRPPDKKPLRCKPRYVKRRGKCVKKRRSRHRKGSNDHRNRTVAATTGNQ